MRCARYRPPEFRAKATECSTQGLLHVTTRALPFYSGQRWNVPSQVLGRSLVIVNLTFGALGCQSPAIAVRHYAEASVLARLGSSMRPNAGHHHAEHRSDHVMLLCLVIDKGLLFISVATATREVRVD
jgi:hypothetical protein